MSVAIDIENSVYIVGDTVNIINSDNVIEQVVITGPPKWRNWTIDGSYDYIYPVQYKDSTVKYICQSNIIE